MRCLGDYGALADARALPPTADGAAEPVAAPITGTDIFQDVLTAFREHCNDNMVLAHVIACFSAAHYAHAVLSMVTLIKAPTLAGRGQGDPAVAWAHLGAQSVFNDVCTGALARLEMPRSPLDRLISRHTNPPPRRAAQVRR